MRKLAKATLLFLITLAITYSGFFWANNRERPQPQNAQLQTTLEAGIDWLDRHDETLLDDNNPMLWYMLQRAAESGGDRRLHTLFDRYRDRYLRNNPNFLWRPLFQPGTWTPVRFQDIESFPYYNQHLIYVITCDDELGSVASIAAQNHPGFCDRYPWKPACATHQLMGIRLAQRSQCGQTEQLRSTMTALQRRIYKELTWDPRVVDVYLQRVLMLVESGARERVKPNWIHRIVQAQRPDGGWSDFQPLIPVSGDTALGFSARLAKVGTPESTFHATVQAVWLFTLLTREKHLQPK